MALKIKAPERLEWVRKVIKAHEDARRFPSGKERDIFIQGELARIKAEAKGDELDYLEKIISPDIPLDQETYPEYFPNRQRGGFPTTLRGLEANYLRVQEGGKDG